MESIERTAEELMEDLHDSIASPVAAELGQLILEADKDAAEAILQEEGFKDPRERQILYDYLYEKAVGVDVDLVELPREKWADAFKEGSLPMVRYGQRFQRSLKYKESRNAPDTDPVVLIWFGSKVVELQRVHQVWEVIPKSKS